jgi:2-iminobutanoate/2-iminopropanoate deaminase
VTKTARDPESIHPPLAGYSHQIELSGDERLLVMSGQVGMHPDGTLPDDPAEQMQAALDNIHRNLEAAGLGWGDLVKLTLYVVGGMSQEQREVLGKTLGEHRPCMTLIVVAGLATPAYKVELDAWASKGG